MPIGSRELYTVAMFEVRCVVWTPTDLQALAAIYAILVSRSALRRLSIPGSSPTDCPPPIHGPKGSSSSLQGGGTLSTGVCVCRHCIGGRGCKASTGLYVQASPVRRCAVLWGARAKLNRSK
jgi:hypothetical protein